MPEVRGALLALVVSLFAASTVASQKADLDGTGHELGDPDAPVVVVEYADFACGACAQFVEMTWPHIRREFVETGRVRWKVVPFELGFRNSEEGARAGECGAAQDMFWEFHDALYEHRDAWVDERNPKDELVTLAERTGLDADRFLECYENETFEDRTKAANDAARTDGVRGTPTFFINGFQAQGALPIEAFRTLLEDAAGSPGGR
ncbi:MAG: thioredoxin domain-containing protein [Gemmatimonadota bacterium]